MKHLFLLASLLMATFATAAQPGPRYSLKRWGITPANYSGIAPLGNGLYAVVNDDEPTRTGFYVWQLDIDSLTGRLRQALSLGFRGQPATQCRDAEGVAYCPQSASVFVSGEADQRVVEHRLDGTLTGHQLAIPAAFGPTRIRHNRGFEALTYCPQSQLFWTCTESPLPADSAHHIRLLSFGRDMQLAGEYAYPLHPQQATNEGRDHYHGIVALAPLADGRLLVLEREARIARHYVGSRCWCRLCVFDPQQGTKHQLTAWRTRFGLFSTRFSNYEGMCLGPTLPGGIPTLILLADSQAAAGRGPWHLRDRIMILKLEGLTLHAQ